MPQLISTNTEEAPSPSVEDYLSDILNTLQEVSGTLRDIRDAVERA